jgi:HAD superfamily hydrolase (TIGR01450 family)
MSPDPVAAVETWVVDLDGVIWLSSDPIPGAADAVRRLRASGRRLVFFTNNSFSLRREMLAKFAAHGIDCAPEELMSSSQVAASLLQPGERALVLGGAGIVEALQAAGVEVVAMADAERGPRPDAVVVGLDLDVQIQRLTVASRTVAAGARFIGTNDDATFPTPDGPLPGGGAILAAVAYASGCKPVIAGKPYEPAAALIRATLGSIAVVVGDRPETDGGLAQRLGARFALVRSGVTPPGVEVHDPHPDFDALDLAALADEVLARP